MFYILFHYNFNIILLIFYFFVIFNTYFIIILYYIIHILLSLYNRTDLHNSLQSLKLAYARATLLYISINFDKFKYWNKYIKKIHENAYYKINEIINHCNNIKYIKNKNKKFLIGQIFYDKEELNKNVFKQIKKNKLKFKYKWQHFGQQENLELMEYILKQKKEWSLNKKTLQDIFLYFDRRFLKETLRRKCFQYGVEYNAK